MTKKWHFTYLYFSNIMFKRIKLTRHFQWAKILIEMHPMRTREYLESNFQELRKHRKSIKIILILYQHCLKSYLLYNIHSESFVWSVNPISTSNHFWPVWKLNWFEKRCHQDMSNIWRLIQNNNKDAIIIHHFKSLETVSYLSFVKVIFQVLEWILCCIHAAIVFMPLYRHSNPENEAFELRKVSFAYVW